MPAIATWMPALRDRQLPMGDNGRVKDRQDATQSACALQCGWLSYPPSTQILDATYREWTGAVREGCVAILIPMWHSQQMRQRHAVLSRYLGTKPLSWLAWLRTCLL